MSVTSLGSGQLKNSGGSGAWFSIATGITLAAGDTILVVAAWGEVGDSQSRSVRWNGLTLTRYTDSVRGGTESCNINALRIVTGATAAVEVNFGNASTGECAVWIFKANDFADPINELSDGTASGSSATPSATTAAAIDGNYVLIGGVHTRGPDGDADGSWGGNITTNLGTLGTTGGGATSNSTVHAGYAIVTAGASATKTASKSGITSRAWETAVAAFRTGTSPTRALVSFAEVEVPSLANKARVSFAELEVPLVSTRARVSFAELEVPVVPTRGRVSFAEVEVPAIPTRALVSFSELEVPVVSTRALVSFTELEVPTVATRARISFTELEVPTIPTRALISFSELEVPTVQTRARVSFAELEVPLVPTRGQVSFTEFEVPDLSVTPNRGLVSFSELEVPSLPTRGLISFAEFETPQVLTRARISFVEFEIPNAPTRARVSFSEMELPSLPNRALVSQAYFEIPNDPAGGGGSGTGFWMLLGMGR